MSLDERIQKVIYGIRSPWGEGAAYDGLSTKNSHLDEDDQVLLREDLKQLIRDVLEEVKPKKTGILSMNTASVSTGTETKKHLVNGWSYDRAIKDMEAKIKELGL